MLLQFQAIKKTSVDFTIDKMLQGFFVKLEIFKRIDAAGESTRCGYADDMVTNPTFDVLLVINCGGWNLLVENCIML